MLRIPCRSIRELKEPTVFTPIYMKPPNSKNSHEIKVGIESKAIIRNSPWPNLPSAVTLFQRSAKRRWPEVGLAASLNLTQSISTRTPFFLPTFFLPTYNLSLPSSYFLQKTTTQYPQFKSRESLASFVVEEQESKTVSTPLQFIALSICFPSLRNISHSQDCQSFLPCKNRDGVLVSLPLLS